MQRNQKGFVHLELILLVVVVGMIAGTGWYVWHASNNANKSLNSASQDQNATQTKKASTPAASNQPAATATTPSTSTPSASKPSSSSASKPKASNPPAAPNLTPSIAISSDGCTVVATGTQGDVLHVDTYNDDKGGGGDYDIPYSGTLTQALGGLQDYTVDATLRNAAGATLVTKSGHMTKDCNL